MDVKELKNNGDRKMKTPKFMQKIGLALVVGTLALLAGCGGGSTPVAVSLTSSAPQGLDQGQSTTITATIANDSTNSGVKWALTGPGTLSGATATSVTYTAPASVPLGAGARPASNVRPRLAAAATATVTATSVKDPTKTASTIINLNPPPAITTTTLPNGTVGASYSQTVQSVGGTSPFTWSVSGSLPAGLSLSSSTGAITGTPTTVGSTTFTVKVTDSASPALSAQQALTIVVVPPPVVIATTSLAGGIVGTAYSATLTATGGTSPFTWSVISGSLPAGLNLSSTGVISGTPTASGTFNFTVQAADSSTPQLTATQALALVITPKLAITTTTLPAGTVGTAYSATLTSTGGTGTITWTKTSGNLPAGLNLSGAGAITGTPTTAGNSTFTVQAMDSGTGSLQQSASQTLSITINPAKLAITTTTLPAGTVGASYSQNLQASGGTAPFTWTLASGTLPAGLSWNNGTISGTPTATGTSTFTVQVADSGTPQQTATQQLTLTINAAPPLTIQTTTLPAATVGVSYSGVIGVSGGVTPYTPSFPSGSLPPGLNISSCNGNCNGAFQITGTPTTAGTFNFTLMVTDSESPAQTASQPYSIVVSAAAPLAITTTTVPGGTVGVAYTYNLQASGGTQPYTWALANGTTLPTGLNLSSAGLISGTPTAAGSTTFTVKVTDSTTPTALTQTHQYTLTVLAAGPNDSELKGSYAFYFGGFSNGNASGAAYGADVIGSLTADGNGNITSGVVDGNNALGFQGQIPFTGNYSIGSDNRGTLAFSMSGGHTVTMAFAVGNIQGGIAQTLRFIEFDDSNASSPTGVIGSGVGKLQTSAAFAMATIKGNFVFGLQGESPCNTCGSGGAAISPYGPVDAAGYFSADGNGNITAGGEDAGAMSTTYSGITLAGSFTAPSATTGYGTITLTPTGTIYPAPPTHFVYYVVGSSEIFMMSSDSHATTTLLTGDVRVQTSNLSGVTLGMGNHVAYQEKPVGGDGVSMYPSQISASLILATVSSGNQMTLFQDKNAAGTITSASLGTVTYSVGNNGRMTLSGTKGSPVFYLYDLDDAFGVEQPSGSGDSPALVDFNLQTGGPFSNTSLAGKYFFGEVPPVVANAGASSGVITLSNGNGSGTDDSASPGSLTSGEAFTLTYSTNSTTGRTTITDNQGHTSVLYIISPTKAAHMSTNTTNTTPTVSIIEQ
jgi:hypothetical protein